MPDVLPPGARAVPSFLTRRKFLAGGIAAAAGVGLYSGTHARHEYEITRRVFPIADLPPDFQNFRIVQMSDIHLEEYTEAWFLQKMIDEVNRMQPDLVLLTGDFISRGPLSDRFAWRAAGLCAEVLTGLKAPQRFAILGNHDVAVGADHIIHALEANGTPVLVDSYVAIERGAGRFWLSGCDDAGTRSPDLNLAVPWDHSHPVILMVHEPDFVDTIVKHPRFGDIDLVLSGHTHGGQVRLPMLGPLVLPPMGRKYIEGLFQFQHMQLYVNRGVGTTGVPFRLNCPAELTELTLVRA